MSNPTVGSDRNSSEVVGFLGIGFRQEVVECRNDAVSCRHPEISAFSDIRLLPVGILYQGFQQLSTNSY